jgi:hypothetical protein
VVPTERKIARDGLAYFSLIENSIALVVGLGEHRRREIICGQRVATERSVREVRGDFDGR